MKSNARHSAPTDIQFAMYQSHGFNIIHNHRVEVNPHGESVVVDFSATDPSMIVQVAIKKAYEAGQRAGEENLQTKLRSLLGVKPPVDD